jgi:hypothetical protein
MYMPLNSLNTKEQQQKEYIQALLKDFRVFLALVWKCLRLPPPTPIQNEIAYYLQHGPRRKIIEGYRGVGKSWTTSAYVLWRLLKDPQRKFLVVSASKQRADDFSTFCHRLIQVVPVLHHLSPRDGQRESKIAWDVGPTRPAHAPSVKSVGIFGQMTGSRATDIVADDIEVPGNSATQDMREKLESAVSEFEAIMTPDQESQITFLGTPQSEETVYNKLAQKGYITRIWPARVPTPDKIQAYGESLSPAVKQMFDNNKHWEPTDPRRFDDEELIGRQASYGLSGFMLQFMLDTTLSDQEKYPLKLSDLILMDTNPERAPVSVQYGSGQEQVIKDLKNVGFTGDRFHAPLWFDKEHWTEYEGSVMFIDPSGRGTDQTGFAVVKHLHGNLFCTDCGGFNGGYEDATLTALAKIAAREKVNEVVIESNFGDGMYQSLFLPVLKKYHKCSIEEKRVNTQKEVRIIDTLEPVMNRHRLVLNRQVANRELKLLERDPQHLQYCLFYQMTRLTKERGALKHDDKLDALAGAVEYWSEYLARDEQEAFDDWKNHQLQLHTEDFLGHILGKDRSTSMTKGSWISNV